MRLFAGIFALSLAVRTATAASLDNPGIFDAYYYFHVAQNTVAGRGLVEDVVWNYLDGSPAALSLPHPSNLYWPPVTSLLASVGIWLFGSFLSEFRAAQVPFVVLSATLPPLSALLAFRLWARREAALTAGLLTVFTALYFRRWVIPESCTPFCLALGFSFVAIFRGASGSWRWFAAAGAGAAVCQLTRADGVLVLAVAMIAAVFRPASQGRAASLTGLGVAYAAVLSPWLWRNLSVAGTAFPGGGVRAMWLLRYEDIFAFQTPVTAARALGNGFLGDLATRLGATVQNVSDVFVIFQFILPPLALVGYWRVRASGGSALLLPVVFYLLALTLFTGLLFPYPALYGTFFHSLAGVAPWLMALVPGGVDSFAAWYARTRDRDPDEMQRFVSRAVLLAVLVATVRHQVEEVGLGSLGGALGEPWNRRLDHFVAVGGYLAERGERGPVLTVSPPAFTVATGLSSAVLPTDGDAAVDAAARHFGARFALLETDGPSWHGARASDGTSAPPAGWTLVREWRDSLGGPVRLFERAPTTAP